MRRNRAACVCFMLLLLALLAGPGRAADPPPRATAGLLDLSGWDFTRDGPAALAGEWHFHWSEHLPVKGPWPASDGFQTVPGVWNKKMVGGDRISGQGYATYRLRVILPQAGPQIGLKFLDAATAFTAYVNGTRIFSSGQPGQDQANTRPGYFPGVVILPGQGQTMDLLIHISNFDHWQGGLWENITLGRLDDLTRLRDQKIFIDALLFGSILIMGIYHLFLYRFRPQDRSTLYFGLFCLLTALRPLFHGERPVMIFLGDGLNLIWFLRINYISFYLCVPLFSWYLITIFPGHISSTVVRIISVAGLLAAATPLVLSPVTFTALMPWLQYATLAAVAYGVYCLARAAVAKQMGARIALAGFLLFFCTIINDILYTRQIISTAHIVPLGFFVFVLCQAILLARRFSLAFDLVTRQQQDLIEEMIQRETAERNLVESERRFRLMTDFMPVPFCETDTGLNIVYANQAAIGWFGYNETEISTGMPLSKVIQRPKIHSFGQLARHLKASREFLVKPKDGPLVWAQMETSPILNKGELRGHRICFIDLSERKKAEAASLEAAKQAKYILVGQVAGKMAHDFNNILSAIMGNTEISLLDCQQEDIRENLTIILEQTKRGHLLTQNLVAFAKDQDPKLECVDINQILDKTLQLLIKDLEGIRVEKTYCPDNPKIMADPGMLEQSLVNIIQNAIHAMSRTDKPVLGLATYVEEGDACIDISDNGCGIAEEFHSQIYTPSFTLKGSRDQSGAYASHIKGTGYGMANVKKYMEKHNGQIRFTSKEGAGTCFTLAIPGADTMCIEDAAKIPAVAVGVSGKKILVVEDEEAIAKVFSSILTHPPFDNEVLVAGDGPSALTLLDAHGFDLVSLDHMLPGAMTGMDVYRHIRKTRPGLPVIFVSGNMEFIASIQKLLKEDPCLAHLSKPCDNLTYARAIERWLA